jgi:hypothetical protein
MPPDARCQLLNVSDGFSVLATGWVSKDRCKIQSATSEVGVIVANLKGYNHHDVLKVNVALPLAVDGHGGPSLTP